MFTRKKMERAQGADFGQDAFERRPLPITLVASDPSTAEAFAAACAALPSYECSLRIACPSDQAGKLEERPGEIVVVDVSSAPVERLCPAAARIALVNSATPDIPDARPDLASATLLHLADLSPTALETAVRSAWRSHAGQMIARAAAAAADSRAQRERAQRLTLVEDIAPIARALDGLVDIWGTDAQFSDGAADARLDQIRNWTRYIAMTMQRAEREIARKPHESADLCAIVEREAARIERGAASRSRKIVLSAPQEPLLAAACEDRLADAMRALFDSIVDREDADRRIELVLWRAAGECCLAVVLAPGARCEAAADALAVRDTKATEARLADALRDLQSLGARIDISADAATGSTILIALDSAG